MLGNRDDEMRNRDKEMLWNGVMLSENCKTVSNMLRLDLCIFLLRVILVIR